MKSHARGRNAALFREFAVGAAVLAFLAAIFVSAAYRRFGNLSPRTTATVATNRVVEKSTPESLPKTDSIAVDRSTGQQTQMPAASPNNSTGNHANHNDRVTEFVPAFVPNPNSLDSIDEPIATSMDAFPVAASPKPLERDQNSFDPPGSPGSQVLAKTVEPQIVTEQAVPAIALPESETADVRAKPEDRELSTDVDVISGDSTNAVQQVSHVVQANDSFWNIAQRAYGSGQYFRALYEHNAKELSDPDRLPVGSRIDIPNLSELREHYPQLCPPRLNGNENGLGARQPDRPATTPTRPYVVKAGDTLFDVARFELGQASRYVEIMQLNADILGQDAARVPAGTHLRIPLN